MAARRSNDGFGLVEIMVGLVIGIVASIVMFQTFAVSERQKRTTTGAADAQSNGAIALYLLERDLKMAGWGLDNSSFSNCTNLYTYREDLSGPLPGNGASLFASALITDGGLGPDSIAIQYYDNPGNKSFRFAVTQLTKEMPSSSSMLFVNSNYGCKEGDLVIVNDTDTNNCTLMGVTNISTSGPDKDGLQHNPGTSPYNPPNNYQNDNAWPAYNKNATVQCFSSIYSRNYRLASEQLELLEPDTTGAIQTYQIAPEIVDLQAQYGIADAGSQQVNAWVDATAAWASPPIADIRRIKALRLAVVARSSQYEKPGSDGVCDTTTADMVTQWSSWATFDTTSYPSEWRCYRYKVFETVVPLRNIIWGKV